MLTAKQQDHLVYLAKFAQLLIDERNGAFIRNYEWYGAPDFDGQITQEALDEFTVDYPNSPLAGMDVDDLSEVEYVNGQVLALIENKFPNLYAVAKGSQ